MKFDADLLMQKKKEIPFKIKSAHIQHKEIDTDNRTIKLVANTLNYFDYDFDALAKGCANRSIANNGAKTDAHDKIAHLLHHDMYRPVGKSLLESEEQINGHDVLYCESFLPETIDGDDTLTKYDVAIFNQHSIGFKYLDLTYLEKGSDGWDKWMGELINPEDADAVGYGWRVNEIKWWEYSTLVFGANKLTPHLGIKSENKLDIGQALSKKIAILANKAMRRDIKNKEAFSFELAQLQQMILELSENGPSVKRTSMMNSHETDTQIQLNGFSKKLNFLK